MPVSAYSRRLNLRYVFTSFFSIFLSIIIPEALAATHTWQGPYIGAYLGGGFGTNQVSTDAGTVTDTSYFTTQADINSVNNAGTWSQNPNSLIGGIQAGHDWVWKQFVYGVVADYSVVPLKSSRTVNGLYSDNSNQYSVYTSISTNRLFTLRGRLGYETMLRWPALLYITGGAAITKLYIRHNFSDNSAFVGMSESNTAENQIGWTAGAGIELASFGHASVDIEYSYVHMPSVKTTSSITNTQDGFGIPIQSLTNSFSTTGKFHASLLKIGLNYRFDE
jgi:outer membrane immunogenic protein